MAKKILGWLIFVLVAVFIGFVIWLFFFKTEPEQSSFSPGGRVADFFPVDNTNNLGRVGDERNQNNTSNVGRNFIPRLRQLSSVPTAGSVAFERVKGSSESFVTDTGVEETSDSSLTVFRYIERATGHLYETAENTLTQTRLSNTTIPKVYEAKFAPGGEHVILRLLNEDTEVLDVLSAKVTSKSTTSPDTFRIVADGYSLEGTFLSPNTVSSDITKDGLSYVVPTNNGGSNLIISSFADLAKKLVFESPLKGWIVQRVNNNHLTITPKADSRVEGYSYLINTDSGSSNKVIGGISGLTTLMSSDEKWVIYSLSRGNELDLFSLNIASGEVKNIGLKTLPEKCVFSRNSSNVLFCGAPTQTIRASYPESWYQGLVSFDDNLWMIDLENGEYTQILGDREDVNQSFDITNLVISPKDEFVLFINKKDLTLWSLDVTVIER